MEIFLFAGSDRTSDDFHVYVLRHYCIGIRIYVWSQAPWQCMDDPADGAGGDPIDLRLGLCLRQPGDHSQGSECFCISDSWTGDDLLRHYLSGEHFAWLDAIYCKLAPTDLFDSWHASSSIFQCRHP